MDPKEKDRRPGDSWTRSRVVLPEGITNTFRAVTVKQPYASLLVSGEKRLLVSKTYPSCLGDIIIHAGGKPMTARELGPAGLKYLDGREYETWPVCAVIGVATLLNVYIIRMVRQVRNDGTVSDVPRGVPIGWRAQDGEAGFLRIDETQEALDHWHAGMYVLDFTNPRALEEPIPSYGCRGFWDVRGPVRRVMPQ